MNPMELRWIAGSARIYRALLILYPADYRREYGALMVQVFRDVCRDRLRRQGIAGIVLWWCKTLLDLTLTAMEQRRKVKHTMSRSTFGQLTGIFLILAGVCGTAAAFSQLQPGDHYRYYGIYQILLLLFVPGFLFTGLGCIGLALRYAEALGKAGQWTLYLSAVGALVLVPGVVVMQFDDSLWNIWLGGGMLHALALTAFGLLHLRKPVLPVFRALPLQLAAGWLVLLLGLLRSDNQAANNALAFLFCLGIGLVWLAIGQTVQRQQREAVPVTA